MAIITNQSRTAECNIKNKSVSFEGGVCKVPSSKIEHIKSECGDIDLSSLVAFNPEEMDHEHDESNPYRVVFVD